jgi:hypothetical protein
MPSRGDPVLYTAKACLISVERGPAARMDRSAARVPSGGSLCNDAYHRGPCGGLESPCRGQQQNSSWLVPLFQRFVFVELLVRISNG